MPITENDIEQITIELLQEQYTQLRDSLLPKLMTGEIDVENVKI